ncbi:unnamed protein product [Prunus armeniaca]
MLYATGQSKFPNSFTGLGSICCLFCGKDASSYRILDWQEGKDTRKKVIRQLANPILAPHDKHNSDNFLKEEHQ